MSTSEKPHEPPTKSALEFDPGLTTRRKQSGCRFICKFILWIFAALISAVILFAIFNLGRGFVNSTIRFAHTSVYQNETWQEAVANGKRNAVVRPLIDEEQSFDVAVTVWLRSTEDELESRAELDNGSLESLTEGDSAPNPEKEDTQERILYDGIVFRGLRLRDKNVRAEVPLQVPTYVFHSENISTSDLRASIVLMPSSPSLLDYATDFSSWYPTLMRRPPVLGPSALGSSNDLQDHALEAFGLNLDLVRLHKSKAANESHTTERDDNPTTDEFWDIQDSEDTGGCYTRSATGDIITAKPSHKLHPYVISRAQIRVSDETHIFNRVAFAKRHKAIKEQACGLRPGVPEIAPDFALCKRKYAVHGNWETIFQLRVPSSTDFIAVPVTRHVCDQNATSAALKFQENPDQDMMNITWHLSFSGRTPNKLVTGELFPPYDPFPDSNVSEWKKQDDHEGAELINSLLGHSYYPDAHPRRKLLLKTTREIFSLVVLILRLVYWSTRASSVHISIYGTWLMASALVLGCWTDLSEMEDFDWLSRIFFILVAAVCDWTIPILMVRTVLPLDLIWPRTNEIPYKGTLSFLFRKARHRERASARLDRRTNKAIVLIVLPALVVLYYLTDPRYLFLVTPTKPLPTDNDISRSIVHTFMTPLWYTGTICQIALNSRSGIFAGSFRLAALIEVMLHLVYILLLSPLMGRDDSRWGWSLDDVISNTLVVATAWQAVRLPRHKRELDVDDEEDSK
ncbi:hypothetical protein Moror_17102 [Moniliophthora roreri MCA 2997]|uniref:Uncharacterized protein n=1 Tax=Moniliophthora roreri (strain MCA 2997) TaxID=1381753 RepID=V2YAV3_MONRO|nr:hypothetical protein Moror_17102 [Moniliophthora roreri MCA 2997]